MSTGKTSLLWILLLSSGLHALVISAWQFNKNPEVSASYTRNPIMLTLTPMQTGQPASTSSSHLVSRTIRQPTLQKKQLKRKPSIVKPLADRQQQKQPTNQLPELTRSEQQHQVSRNTERKPDINPDAAAATEQHKNRQLLTERIQKQLNIKVAFIHRYPGMAIRNAWQGRVNLGIRVLANGELTNIHVIDSSGYRILDNAAVNSVRHVAALPEASPWLQGQPVDVILPVIYRLTDS